MAESAVFWSYAHADDEAEDGRITRLARSVVQEHALLAGEAIDLFLDRESLAWGDAWRSRIDSALAQTTFFVPVITPRFLMSEECRRELIEFIGNAKGLGVNELLLPILYVRPTVDEGAEPDELFETVSAYQWEPWDTLRLEDEDSAIYRRAVNRLADRLITATATLDLRASSGRPIGAPNDVQTTSENAALIARIATADRFLPACAENLRQLGAILPRISAIVDETSVSFSEPTRLPATGREYVLVARQLSTSLAEPIADFEQRATRTASAALELDAEVLAILRELEVIAQEVPEGQEFLANLRGTGEIASDIAVAIDGLTEQISSISDSSRDLHLPLRRLVTSLRLYTDVRAIVENWAARASSLASP